MLCWLMGATFRFGFDQKVVKVEPFDVLVSFPGDLNAQLVVFH